MRMGSQRRRTTSLQMQKRCTNPTDARELLAMKVTCSLTCRERRVQIQTEFSSRGSRIRRLQVQFLPSHDNQVFSILPRQESAIPTMFDGRKILMTQSMNLVLRPLRKMNGHQPRFPYLRIPKDPVHPNHYRRNPRIKSSRHPNHPHPLNHSTILLVNRVPSHLQLPSRTILFPPHPPGVRLLLQITQPSHLLSTDYKANPTFWKVPFSEWQCTGGTCPLRNRYLISSRSRNLSYHTLPSTSHRLFPYQVHYKRYQKKLRLSIY